MPSDRELQQMRNWELQRLWSMRHKYAVGHPEWVRVAVEVRHRIETGRMKPPID